MFERLKGLYLKDKLTDSGIEKAVQKGWITEDDHQAIKLAKKIMQGRL